MHDKTTTTAVKQHLKVKDIEKDVGLKSLHYFNMQKICSIHTLTLTVKQILRFCELKGCPFLTPTHRKTIKVIFSFPEFVPAL